MLKTFVTKSFLVSIYSSLILASCIFIALLWNRFGDLDRMAEDHVLHQKSVVLVKDVKFHVVQIQQFLTDVSLTHRQEGFESAKKDLQGAQTGLQALAQLRPALRDTCEALSKKVTLTYETGVRMASNYLYKGEKLGNLTMTMLDNNSVILADELNRLADQVDQELQESAIANSLSIKRNQMILMLSVPMVLGIFGGLIVKFSLLLKQQMRNLELRTSQLNSILNTAPSAIITVDDLANVLTFNPAAERIFGYTPNEIIGNSINRLMPLEVAAGHDAYIKNYLKTGQAKVIGMPREVMAVRQNGEEFPAQFRINCMEIEGKSFFCGIIDDISETKTLQVQLNQAQKLEAIGQMASGVAHEINTPIQYIGDNLSALKENFVDIIEFQKKLNSINAEEIQTQLHSWKSQHDLDFILEDSPKAIQQALEGVEKVSEIVKAMKTFSHMEPSQGTQVINLHEAINSALIISRNSYKYYADIETDFSKDVESLECYPSELNQVFLNLIINAAHAIEEKYSVDRRGLIRIGTRLIPGMVEILIQDNGSGIPEAIQEKVYNLFFTTKPVGKGTGQGLSLSHSIIVEKHQGKLFFESSHAEGTTFHIQLPLKMVNTGTNNHG